MTREELLAEWDRTFDSRPAWLETLTNEGIEYHLETARRARESLEPNGGVA